MSYVEKALAILKQNNYKITPKRELALQCIETYQGVFSPYDFVAAYPEAKFDKVTLYRFFDVLESLHLLQKIHSLNGYVRTDGGDHDHQHYFLVCSDCYTCEEKVFDQEKLNLQELGVFPKNHSVEIVGHCKPCQTKDHH